MGKRRKDREQLPCCERPAELGEYLLANEAGPCCVGCYLAFDLAAQGGSEVVIDALRAVPMILPPKKVKAIRRAGMVPQHTRAHPDHDCRGCGTPLIRGGKFVDNANRCPDCGEIICIPCLEGGKVKCQTGKDTRN